MKLKLFTGVLEGGGGESGPLESMSNRLEGEKPCEIRNKIEIEIDKERERENYCKVVVFQLLYIQTQNETSVRSGRRRRRNSLCEWNHAVVTIGFVWFYNFFSWEIKPYTV